MEPPDNSRALTPVVIRQRAKQRPRTPKAPRPPALSPWIWRCVDCGATGLVSQHKNAEPTAHVRQKIAQDHATLTPRYPVVDIWLRMDQPGKIMFRDNAVVISYDKDTPQFEVIHVINAEEERPDYNQRARPGGGRPGGPFAGHNWKGRPL